MLVTANLTLKITDFGVAKVKPLNHSTKMSTAGTFAWMAPEAIKFQNYSEFSDVWSFGVILWELLTGETPYENVEPYCIAYGVATRNLKLPIPQPCPLALQNLLEQCWKEGMIFPSFTFFFFFFLAAVTDFILFFFFLFFSFFFQRGNTGPLSWICAKFWRMEILRTSQTLSV